MRRKDREITDRNEVIAIVQRNKTCHIAMVDNGMPYVVPMSYGSEFENGSLTLYFHSAKEGRKIEVLRKNPNVCFDISVEKEITIDSEKPCHSGRFYESVIGFGHVEFIEDIQEKCEALSRLMHTQSNGGHFTFDEKAANAVCVFKIVVDEFTGKRKVPKQA
ncbi:MAG: pyridoxamine 5'-phosphate oxidase family protein [Fibrobacter sp.]|uniref:pyridoxamine 5'-phosphate oxidase family protein n=1 Tax=Fibrobacter sp. TaxID=35828 RepID=UPI0025B89CB7|nr:pyridoxamine 5'-phosphate oxidase family protein [Fibrobacter sp.]MBQ7079083.1 pyridoxamine 5'-phosphate oxidase family protein [Fibrobacter sp.]